MTRLRVVYILPGLLAFVALLACVEPFPPGEFVGRITVRVEGDYRHEDIYEITVVSEGGSNFPVEPHRLGGGRTLSGSVPGPDGLDENPFSFRFLVEELHLDEDYDIRVRSQARAWPDGPFADEFSAWATLLRRGGETETEVVFTAGESDLTRGPDLPGGALRAPARAVLFTQQRIVDPAAGSGNLSLARWCTGPDLDRGFEPRELFLGAPGYPYPFHDDSENFDARAITRERFCVYQNTYGGLKAGSWRILFSQAGLGEDPQPAHDFGLQSGQNQTLLVSETDPALSTELPFPANRDNNRANVVAIVEVPLADCEEEAPEFEFHTTAVRLTGNSGLTVADFGEEELFQSRDARWCYFSKRLDGLQVGEWALAVGEVNGADAWQTDCRVPLAGGDNTITFRPQEPGCRAGEAVYPEVAAVAADLRLHVQVPLEAERPGDLLLGDCSERFRWEFDPLQPDEGSGRAVATSIPAGPRGLNLTQDSDGQTYCVFKVDHDGLRPGLWEIDVFRRDELTVENCRQQLRPGRNDLFFTVGENACTSALPWPSGSIFPPV